MDRPARRSRCRGADFLVIYSTWWLLPSKTHRKINKKRNFCILAERYSTFTIDNRPSRPRSPRSHPRAQSSSRTPPRPLPDSLLHKALIEIPIIQEAIFEIPTIHREKLQPWFGQKNTFSENTFPKICFVLVAWAEPENFLNSKVLRRGWRGFR